MVRATVGFGHGTWPIVGGGGGGGGGQEGLHQNEPEGTTVVFERYYTEEDPEGWSDFDGSGADPTSQQFSIVEDPTAPSGTGLTGEIFFPEGHTGSGSGSRTATSIRAIDPIVYGDTIYIECWIKPSDPFDGHDGGLTKIYYGGHPFYANLDGTDEAPLHFTIAVQGGSNIGVGYDSTGNEITPDEEAVRIIRGQWNHLEMLAVMNSDGVADGSMRLWVNGVESARRTNSIEILEVSTEVGREQYMVMDFFQWHPIYGGQNGANTPYDQYQRIDYIYMSKIAA